jgi:hypothetical protein
MPGRIVKTGFSSWVASLLALGFLGGVVPAEESPKPPRAVVPRMILDLGVVPVGPDAVSSFAIHNNGEGTLKIFEVDTSCSCTVADFDPLIGPGSVGHVRVNLLTTELSGPVTKGVIVRTNDPQQETIVLTLKALVRGSVSLFPESVIFMRKRAGETPVGRLLISKARGEEGALEISDVTLSDPRLVATAVRLETARPRGGGLPAAAPGDWVLEVRFRDDMTVYGRVEEQLRFRTGLARQPEMTVELESNLQAPVTLSTKSLVLDRTEDGARGTVFVSVRKGLDPGLLRVEVEPAGLDVEIEPSTERLFKLQVSWAGGALSGASIRLAVGEDSVVLPVELPGR